MLDMFDSPMLSFVLGRPVSGGRIHARTAAAGWNLSAGARRYVMAAVALLLIANGIYQSTRGR